MSEQWMGLHNPERHITTTSGKRAMCDWEGQHNHDTWCDQTNPCYCCLAAEVEALRAQANRPSLDDLQVEDYRRVRAQVQAVREAVERHERIYAPSDAEGIPVQVILRALDGGAE